MWIKLLFGIKSSEIQKLELNNKLQFHKKILIKCASITSIKSTAYKFQIQRSFFYSLHLQSEKSFHKHYWHRI